MWRQSHQINYNLCETRDLGYYCLGTEFRDLVNATMRHGMCIFSLTAKWLVRILRLDNLKWLPEITGNHLCHYVTGNLYICFESCILKPIFCIYLTTFIGALKLLGNSYTGCVRLRSQIKETRIKKKRNKNLIKIHAIVGLVWVTLGILFYRVIWITLKPLLPFQAIKNTIRLAVQVKPSTAVWCEIRFLIGHLQGTARACFALHKTRTTANMDDF